MQAGFAYEGGPERQSEQQIWVGLFQRWHAMDPWRKATWAILARYPQAQGRNGEWNVDVERLVLPDGFPYQGLTDILNEPFVESDVLQFWMARGITPSVP